MRPMNAAIRLLSSSSRDAIARHLTDLSMEERAARFGAPLDDTAIGHYAARLNFGRDRLLGVFEEDAALVGVAHIGLELQSDAASLGLSISHGSRCRGYGYALLCAAALQARRAARTRLLVPGLADNRIMVHLARKAGLSVIDEFGRAGTCLTLGEVPQLPPAQRLGGRRSRALLLGVLVPFFCLDMALMIGVSSCGACKPPAVVSQR